MPTTVDNVPHAFVTGSTFTLQKQFEAMCDVIMNAPATPVPTASPAAAEPAAAKARVQLEPSAVSAGAVRTARRHKRSSVLHVRFVSEENHMRRWLRSFGKKVADV